MDNNTNKSGKDDNYDPIKQDSYNPVKDSSYNPVKEDSYNKSSIMPSKEDSLRAEYQKEESGDRSHREARGNSNRDDYYRRTEDNDRYSRESRNKGEERSNRDSKYSGGEDKYHRDSRNSDKYTRDSKLDDGDRYPRDSKYSSGEDKYYKDSRNGGNGDKYIKDSKTGDTDDYYSKESKNGASGDRYTRESRNGDKYTRDSKNSGGDDYYTRDSRVRESRGYVRDDYGRKDHRSTKEYDDVPRSSRDERRYPDRREDERARSRRDAGRTRDTYTSERDKYQNIIGENSLSYGNIGGSNLISNNKDGNESSDYESAIEDKKPEILKEVQKPVPAPLTGFELVLSHKRGTFQLSDYYNYAMYYLKGGELYDAKEAVVYGISKARRQLMDAQLNDKQINDSENVLKCIFNLLYGIIAIICHQKTFILYYDELHNAMNIGLSEADRLVSEKFGGRIEYSIIRGYFAFFSQKYPLSREFFERALTIKSDSATALYGMGLACYFDKDYKMALKHFLKVLVIQVKGELDIPFKVIDVRVAIAQCHLKLNNINKFFFVLKGATKQSPNDDKMLAYYLVTLLNQFKKNPKLMIKLDDKTIHIIDELQITCENAILQFPENQVVNIVQAELYFFERDFEKAFEFAKKASIEVGSYDPYVNSEAAAMLGKIYYFMKDYDNAKFFFEHALKYNPYCSLASIGVILVSVIKGDFVAAKKAGEHAIKNNLWSLDPKSTEDIKLTLFFIIVSCQVMYINGPGESDEFRIAARVAKKHLDSFMSSMDINLKDDMFNAFSAYGRAYTKTDSLAPLSINEYNYANAIYLENDEPSARIKLSKNFNNIGVCYLTLGQNQDAFESFRKAVKAIKYIDNEESKMVWITYSFNTAVAFESAGLIKSAKEIYKTLNEEYPSYFQAPLRLGIIAYRNREYFKARSYFYQVVESCKDSTKEEHKLFCKEAHLFLAQIYHNVKVFDKSIEKFKWIIDHLDKENVYAHCAIAYNNYCIARTLDGDKRRRIAYFNESVKYFILAREIDPGNPFMLTGFAALLNDRQIYDIPLKIFNIIKSSLHYVEMDRNLGIIQYRNELYEESLASLEKVLKHGKYHDYRVLQMKARVQHALSLKKKNLRMMLNCIDTMREAVKLEGQNVLKYDLGIALQSYSVMVANMDPKEVGRAMVDFALEHIEEARKVFDECSKATDAGIIYSLDTCKNRFGFATTIKAKLEVLKEFVYKNTKPIVPMPASQDYLEHVAEFEAKEREEREKEEAKLLDRKRKRTERKEIRRKKYTPLDLLFKQEEKKLKDEITKAKEENNIELVQNLEKEVQLVQEKYQDEEAKLEEIRKEFEN